MKDELYFYDIYPKVLPTEKETEITIHPLSPHKAFNEKEYTVVVLPMTYDNYSKTKPTVFSTVLSPKNGDLVFSHTFKGEQEHQIRVFSATDLKRCIVKLSVYSLEADLMELTPLMGDFHVHTSYSDGKESPAFVCAMYREAGYDFTPITDHGMYFPSTEAVDTYKDLDLDFKIYNGEEVHTPGNHVHIINFASDYSVNALAKDNTDVLWSCDPKQEWLDEVNALADTLEEPPEGVDKFVYASCLLVYKKIREANGMCIFCHPHWIADVYHVSDSVTKFFLENNFADCFELIGGQSNLENSMQVAMWQDVQATKGVKVPVVGNSDSHGTVNSGLFNIMKTIVFAKSNTREDIISAVKNGYSVALFDKGVEDVQMYASYRMVSYAIFLYHNYFPLHRELCQLEGKLMRAYVGGDMTAVTKLKALKGQVPTLVNKLFVQKK